MKLKDFENERDRIAELYPGCEIKRLQFAQTEHGIRVRSILSSELIIRRPSDLEDAIRKMIEMETRFVSYRHEGFTGKPLYKVVDMYERITGHLRWLIATIDHAKENTGMESPDSPELADARDLLAELE